MFSSQSNASPCTSHATHLIRLYLCTLCPSNCSSLPATCESLESIASPETNDSNGSEWDMQSKRKHSTSVKDNFLSSPSLPFFLQNWSNTLDHWLASVWVCKLNCFYWLSSFSASPAHACQSFRSLHLTLSRSSLMRFSFIVRSLFSPRLFACVHLATNRCCCCCVHSCPLESTHWQGFCFAWRVHSRRGQWLTSLHSTLLTQCKWCASGWFIHERSRQTDTNSKLTTGTSLLLCASHSLIARGTRKIEMMNQQQSLSLSYSASPEWARFARFTVHLFIQRWTSYWLTLEQGEREEKTRQKCSVKSHLRAKKVIQQAITINLRMVRYNSSRW